MPVKGQFVLVLSETTDGVIHFDGQAVPVRTGETVMAALMRAGAMLGRSEFDGAPRAGFCLMGACQDCTVWQDVGGRLRACMTQVRDGMRLSSRSPLAAMAPVSLDGDHE